MILCKLLGFRAIKKKDLRNWIKLEGIAITELRSVMEFIKLGPITDVKISRKSPRFQGISKLALCLATKDVIEDRNIPLSKYFKHRKEAFDYKYEMDQILINRINKYQNI